MEKIEKIKITSKGQITIPKKIREELYIKRGMYLGGYVKEGSIVLKPLPENKNRADIINYAHQKSKDSVGLERVRKITKGFNLGMQKQVRKLREEE